MKIFLVCGALVLHLAVAFGGECYIGSSIDGVGDMQVEYCGFPKESCMTKIEVNRGQTKIVRRCIQTKACGSHTTSNDQQCYTDIYTNQVRVCYFCCGEDLCNNFVDPPMTTVAPVTTTSAPATATLEPDTTTPAPETTTPEPDTTTPTPETTTPAPETTTPVPETTTPVPETTTPAPVTTTPAPETTTSVPETTTPVPETTTPVPE
uniref:Uncharacterized protein n=2 Tax=Ciona intestinalis TaxID=7719 RepID=F6XDW5_CIOIN